MNCPSCSVHKALILRLVGAMGLLAPLPLTAQFAPEEVFTALQLSPGAQVAALGGSTAVSPADDPAAAWYNPATASDTLGLRFSAASGLQTTGITQYHAAAGWAGPSGWAFTAGLFGISYGEFVRRDAFGNNLGTFSGGETALYATATRRYGPLQVGGGLTFLYAQLDGLSATALALNAGIYYAPAGKPYRVGLVVRNAGVPLSTYEPTADAGQLPLDIVLGGSYRVPRAPFRLHLHLTQLNTWVFTETEDGTADAVGLGENLTRRLVLGLEVLAGRVLTLRAGYNGQRRLDLQADDQAFGFAGLSVGLGMQLPRWGFDFAFAGAGAAAGTTHLAVGYRVK